jgi:hypothetical protein
MTLSELLCPGAHLPRLWRNTMKRTLWTVVVSLATLIAVGCGKTETTNTPAPEIDAKAGDSGKTPQGVESGGTKPAGGFGVTKSAADSGTAQQPAENDSGKKPEGGVHGAIGKALLKGITGGSGAKKNEAEEAPKLEP